MARNKKTTTNNRINKKAAPKKESQASTAAAAAATSSATSSDAVQSGRVPTPQDTTRKTFMDLPSECRNYIYSLCAEEVSRFAIRGKGKAHTVAAHPLTAVCHQIHKEFAGIIGGLSLHSHGDVKVQVVDFDFYPLITFLDQMAAHAQGDYRAFQWNGGRILKVEMEFTREFPRNPQGEKLGKWLQYLKNKVSGLECYQSVTKVVDRQGTKTTLEMLNSGLGENDYWRTIVQDFRNWEWFYFGHAEQIAAEEAERNREKTDLEKAVEDYYNEIYAQMDAANQQAATQEDEAKSIKQEPAHEHEGLEGGGFMVGGFGDGGSWGKLGV